MYVMFMIMNSCHTKFYPNSAGDYFAELANRESQGVLRTSNISI